MSSQLISLKVWWKIFKNLPYAFKYFLSKYICIILQADEAISWFQKRLKNAINYGLSSEDSKLFGKNDDLQ